MSTESIHLFGRLHDAIEKANRVLLVAHKKPDGDTLGSSSSVLNWLIREGKDVTVFCADVPPPSFRYLDNIHRYTNDPAVFHAAYDIVIVFDSGDLRYCGVADHVPHLAPGHLLVNIDHHNTNQFFGHLNLVFTEATSTAEVVHRFFEANNVRIDDHMATSILTGLLTDTGNFSNAATTSAGMEIASKMLSAGARNQDILHHILHNQSLPMLKLWGLALSRMQHNATWDITSTYLLQADMADAPADVVDGLSNFLNAVTGQTDTILVLRELPNNEIKGSFRSIRRDISKLAKLLGGGGHKKAAAFTMRGRIEITPSGPRIV